MQQVKTFFKAKQYMIPVTLYYEDLVIYVQFAYNPVLLAEIKSFEGAKWLGYENPPKKIWRVANTPRNAFQIAYLQGANPYAPYDLVPEEQEYSRLLRGHQKEMSDFIIARKHCVIAGEMGVGKTLSVIEAIEHFTRTENEGNEVPSNLDFWYVAPRSGLKAVEREFKKWQSTLNPTFMTYEGVTKRIKTWEINDYSVPRVLVLDESSRVKTPTAQRSQAALALADMVRDTYGTESLIILMSGTPAPRAPVDWWHQSEIACPGFLKEGTYFKFKKALCILSEEESSTGGKYQSIVTWLDDTNKCAVCGDLYEGHTADDHVFKASSNEVARLAKRLEGLVLVKRKKDCLDLPDKIYREIEIPASKQLLQVARTLIKSAKNTISGLTLLRELSDGFQYKEVPNGFKNCEVCNGSKEIDNPLLNATIDRSLLPENSDFTSKKIKCDGCGGRGTVETFKRVVQDLGSPKDQVLFDLLDENSEIGRLVVYAGFTGSIDRITKLCLSQKWEVIRVDGRGWWSSVETEDYLSLFQDQLEQHPRVVFVGQPGAAGMGLTLTAASMIVYYSNDFNSESRVQSEDRIHRIGTDANRGATIVDLIHLETDRLVLDNLQKKKKLQLLTLGEIEEALRVT